MEKGHKAVIRTPRKEPTKPIAMLRPLLLIGATIAIAGLGSFSFGTYSEVIRDGTKDLIPLH